MAVPWGVSAGNQRKCEVVGRLDDGNQARVGGGWRIRGTSGRYLDIGNREVEYIFWWMDMKKVRRIGVYGPRMKISGDFLRASRQCPASFIESAQGRRL
jgi:hypothetical protein